MSDPHDFVTSIENVLVGGARQAGFTGPLWVPRGTEEILAAFLGRPFDLLVYCPAGHGVNMTVTVAPETNAKRTWNPHDEVGLAWLSEALHLAPWNSSRYSSTGEREKDIQELSRRLPEFVSAARARGASLWSDVRRCIRSKVVRGSQ